MTVGPDGRIVDAGAVFDDCSGQVEAQRVRKAHGEDLVDDPCPEPRVHRVERRRRDGNEHFSGAGPWCRGLFVAQDVDVAVLVKTDGLHGVVSS